MGVGLPLSSERKRPLGLACVWVWACPCPLKETFHAPCIANFGYTRLACGWVWACPCPLKEVWVAGPKSLHSQSAVRPSTGGKKYLLRGERYENEDGKHDPVIIISLQPSHQYSIRTRSKAHTRQSFELNRTQRRLRKDMFLENAFKDARSEGAQMHRVHF